VLAKCICARRVCCVGRVCRICSLGRVSRVCCVGIICYAGRALYAVLEECTQSRPRVSCVRRIGCVRILCSCKVCCARRVLCAAECVGDFKVCFARFADLRRLKRCSSRVCYRNSIHKTIISYAGSYSWTLIQLSVDFYWFDCTSTCTRSAWRDTETVYDTLI
jgi:hypothetical protein